MRLVLSVRVRSLDGNWLPWSDYPIEDGVGEFRGLGLKYGGEVQAFELEVRRRD